MRAIPDLQRQLVEIGANVTLLQEGLLYLRRCHCDQLVPGLAAQRTEAEGKLGQLESREKRLKTDLRGAWATATTYALGIVAAAWVRQPVDHLEERLLALLDGEELPGDDLTEEEHAYVVAALAAREATGQETRAVAFESFIAARAILLGERRAA